MRKSAQNSFYGVESVLSNLKSEKTAVNWQGLEASETRAKYLYRSEERWTKIFIIIFVFVCWVIKWKNLCRK